MESPGGKIRQLRLVRYEVREEGTVGFERPIVDLPAGYELIEVVGDRLLAVESGR